MRRPRLHIIGDSISLDYGPFLARAIQGVFEYSRKGGEEEALLDLDVPRGANGGDSRMVLAYLEGLRTAGRFATDLLLVNCGLHDIKTDPATGTRAVAPDAYAENLRAIVEAARGLAARMVWITTTPVDDAMHAARACGFGRVDADVIRYNGLARSEMAALGIDVLDLGRYTRSLGAGPEIFRDGVHFLNPVKQLQAGYIAGWLEGSAR